MSRDKSQTKDKAGKPQEKVQSQKSYESKSQSKEGDQATDPLRALNSQGSKEEKHKRAKVAKS